MINNSMTSKPNSDERDDLFRKMSTLMDEAAAKEEFQPFRIYFEETRNRLECTRKILNTDPESLKLDLIQGKFSKLFQEFQTIQKSIVSDEQALIQADQARQHEIQLEIAQLKNHKQQILMSINAELKKVYSPTLKESTLSIALDCVWAAFTFLTGGIGFGSCLMQLIRGIPNSFKHYKDGKGWGAMISSVLKATTSCFIAEAIRHLTASDPYSIYTILSLGITTNLINRAEQYVQLKRDLTKLKLEHQKKKNERKFQRVEKNLAFAEHLKTIKIESEKKLKDLQATKLKIINLAKVLEEMTANKESQPAENIEILPAENKPNIVIDFNSKAKCTGSKRKRKDISETGEKVRKLEV
ncbi:MAG: hypothetical protein U1E78_07530 [Gammaproteobacteria bacterium]